MHLTPAKLPLFKTVYKVFFLGLPSKLPHHVLLNLVLFSLVVLELVKATHFNDVNLDNGLK